MNPQVILVDHNDNAIGAIDRSEITSVDFFRVAALWLTDQYGNILIAQRKLDKLNDPGKWGPAVAGTIEVGETYESNIYKEAEEELGLIGLDFHPGPIQLVEHTRSFHCHWFTSVADQEYPFKLQPEEVEKVAWISPEDLHYEITNHPEKYIHSMYESIRLFGI